MTTELAAWLLEQIAEDEQKALAVSASELSGSITPAGLVALGPRWEARQGVVAAEGITWDGVGEGLLGTTLWDVRNGRTTSWFAAEHIAHWDPARVLAECDAKRRIVAEHQPSRVVGTRCGSCGACPDCAWDDDPDDPDWPCSTLKLLALPYADRPGYRAEWR